MILSNVFERGPSDTVNGISRRALEAIQQEEDEEEEEETDNKTDGESEETEMSLWSLLKVRLSAPPELVFMTKTGKWGKC